MQTKNKIFIAIKWLIFIISTVFISCKLYNQSKEHDILSFFSSDNTGNLIVLFFVTGLMLINWGLEAGKWKKLVAELEVISFYQSMKAIFAGVTVSVFTPNRIGEFAGRVLALSPKHRIEAIFATLIGNISQLLVTLIAGAIAFPFYLRWYPARFELEFSPGLIFFALAVVISVGLAVYLNAAKIANGIKRLVKRKRITDFISFIEGYKINDLLKVFFLSVLRYLVFLIQFLLLLKFFEVQIPIFKAIAGIALIYLLLAAVPTIALAEFGVRGSLAIFILGAFTPLAAELVMVTFFLWIINLALPALIGAVLQLKFKI